MECSLGPQTSPQLWDSGSDSDADRPDPDVVLDDLACRRFHSPSPVPPTNFAVPISPVSGGQRDSKVTSAPGLVPQLNVTSLRSENVTRRYPLAADTWLSLLSSSDMETQQVRISHRAGVSHVSLFRDGYDDSEDEDDDVGYADPVQDDLYTRKVGVKPQATGSASYDKFLPKFWTPEEDIHIRKIKMGSKRRPWYKKMQGFSTLVQAHTPPQPPSIPPLLLPPPLVFAPVDPTSGPRLVKCEKRPLLGRQDPREPPDPIDYDSIVPDLQNDDMFTRRTLAFQSNDNLVLMKIPVRRRLYSSEPQLNIVTQRRADAEEEEFPDIDEDDVVYRKEKTLQAQQQRPLSGAPDNYYPMPIPEPWALPDDLKARLLCPPCPLPLKSSANKENRVEDHPKTDDMLMRKLGVCSSQNSSVNQTAPSVPTSCCEGDLQKWQEIREASQIRYKKKLLVERLAALKMLN
ncbi:LIM domain only protein 7-like [Neosynchiropus ocellatus]